MLDRGRLSESDDLDDIIRSGIYVAQGKELNRPDEGWAVLAVMAPDGSLSTASQLFIGAGGRVYARVRTGNPMFWDSWRKLA